MTIQTAHFGAVEIPEEDVIELTEPLPPFMDLYRYALLARSQEEPFLWLQAIDQPALALVLVPYEAVATTMPKLSTDDRQGLGLVSDEEPQVYAIVSLGDTAAETTVNLLAPLYLCLSARKARQIVHEGTLALTQAPLLAADGR